MVNFNEITAKLDAVKGAELKHRVREALPGQTDWDIACKALDEQLDAATESCLRFAKKLTALNKLKVYLNADEAVIQSMHPQHKAEFLALAQEVRGLFQVKVNQNYENSPETKAIFELDPKLEEVLAAFDDDWKNDLDQRKDGRKAAFKKKIQDLQSLVPDAGKKNEVEAQLVQLAAKIEAAAPAGNISLAYHQKAVLSDLNNFREIQNNPLYKEGNDFSAAKIFQGPATAFRLPPADATQLIAALTAGGAPADSVVAMAVPDARISASPLKDGDQSKVTVTVYRNHAVTEAKDTGVFLRRSPQGVGFQPDDTDVYSKNVELIQTLSEMVDQYHSAHPGKPPILTGNDAVREVLYYICLSKGVAVDPSYKPDEKSGISDKFSRLRKPKASFTEEGMTEFLKERGFVTPIAQAKEALDEAKAQEAAPRPR